METDRNSAFLTSCIELTAHFVMHIGVVASEIMNHIEIQDGVLLPAGRERQKLPSAHIYTIIPSQFMWTITQTKTWVQWNFLFIFSL